MDPFTIKRGDTRPLLDATLSDDDGPVDLTGATVRLVVRRATPRCGEVGALLLKRECEIIDAAAGKVRYAWQPDDTATVGSYAAEFEVAFVGGGLWTFPSAGYVAIIITPDLG